MTTADTLERLAAARPQIATRGSDILGDQQRRRLRDSIVSDPPSMSVGTQPTIPILPLMVDGRLEFANKRMWRIKFFRHHDTSLRQFFCARELLKIGSHRRNFLRL